MRIAILGTGTVGEHLAAGLRDHGHDIVMGTRDPARVATTGVEAASHAEAVQDADLVVLAVQGSAAEAAVKLAGPENLAGKVLVDVTNPLTDGPDGAVDTFGVPGDSNAEKVQRAAPAARIVKCWNTVTASQMIDPAYDPPAEMLICGNDAEAKALVTGLLGEVGWPARDVGALREAFYLEALVGLWVRVGRSTGRWDHAFRLVWPSG